MSIQVISRTPPPCLDLGVTSRIARAVPAVHRTILVFDVAGFSDPQRTNQHQLVIRDALYRIARQACHQSGVPWAHCDQEDRGDGLLLLVPSTVPKSVIANELPDYLLRGLREYNDGAPEVERIHLRVAIHAGEVNYDRHGVTGAAVTHTFRLADTTVLKAALADSGRMLGLVASTWFYTEVVRHSRPELHEQFQQVAVAVKETHGQAWISIPDDMPLHASQPFAPRDPSTNVSFPTTRLASESHSRAC